MEKRSIAKSELVLTPESRIYHLHLKPEDVADIIFLVGDPGRVKTMSALFDTVDIFVENREFVSHTGIFNKKRVSVISTGIGTDNIDIVVNELDALVNIDFSTRSEKKEKKSLKIIRIGTSGALHAEIEPGSVIVSKMAGGLDNLMRFYDGIEQISDQRIESEFTTHMDWNKKNSTPYFIPASKTLLNLIQKDPYFYGITLAAPGFYAPQGRSLRLKVYDEEYVDKISRFRSGDLRINNFEMEGSALYGLSTLLGHEALTICIALANRITGKFITDYQPFVISLLKEVLTLVTADD
ncbi:MAG: nucleoside phosphorylase [Bacteroidales bacterium]|jgi:uridine phosphorylase|nr:nucleoside phosphorylase [Bacteroidales bacterium]